jgi:hypothetical protein
VVGVKNELLSKIEEIPEFKLVSVYVRKKKQKGFKAVVEKNGTEAIAVVSDKYNLVQIRDLFRNVVECCGESVSGTALYYRGKGDLMVFPDGSNIGLLAQNSVDLSSAVRIGFVAKTEDGQILSIPYSVAAPFVRIHTAKDIQVQIEQYLELLGQVREAWEQIVASLGGLELTREDIEQLKKSIRAGKHLSEIIDRHLPDPNQGTLAPVRFWEFVQIVMRAIAEHRRRYKSELNFSRKIRKIGNTILEWAVFEKLKISLGPRPG